MQTELEKFGEAISYISDALHYPFLQENKVRNKFFFFFLFLENTESDISDVIKIRLKRKGRMRGELGKETPKKEMDLDVFL